MSASRHDAVLREAAQKALGTPFSGLFDRVLTRAEDDVQRVIVINTVEATTEGGAEHIEALSQRYTGAPYAWYGGRSQVRVVLTISADKIHSLG